MRRHFEALMPWARLEPPDQASRAPTARGTKRPAIRLALRLRIHCQQLIGEPEQQTQRWKSRSWPAWRYRTSWGCTARRAASRMRRTGCSTFARIEALNVAPPGRAVAGRDRPAAAAQGLRLRSQGHDASRPAAILGARGRRRNTRRIAGVAPDMASRPHAGEPRYFAWISAHRGGRRRRDAGAPAPRRRVHPDVRLSSQVPLVPLLDADASPVSGDAWAMRFFVRRPARRRMVASTAGAFPRAAGPAPPGAWVISASGPSPRLVPFAAGLIRAKVEDPSSLSGRGSTCG